MDSFKDIAVDQFTCTHKLKCLKDEKFPKNVQSVRDSQRTLGDWQTATQIMATNGEIENKN